MITIDGENVLVDSDRQLINEQITSLWQAENSLQNSVSNLSLVVSGLNGQGGALTANDFGTGTPSQQQLTNYALSQIPDITTPTDIFNNTWVVNTFNNSNIMWKLVNTPNTAPPIFEWINIGNSTVAPFGIGTAGTLMGVNQDGCIIPHSSGGGIPFNWNNKANIEQVNQAVASVTASSIGAATSQDIANSLTPILQRLTNLENRKQVIPHMNKSAATSASIADPDNYQTYPEGT